MRRRAHVGGAGHRRRQEAQGIAGRLRQELESGNELRVSEGSRVMRVLGSGPILSLDGRMSIVLEIHLLARCHKPLSCLAQEVNIPTNSTSMLPCY